jgi:DNA-binding transcriptional regulator GbsR (MarR family)
LILPRARVFDALFAVARAKRGDPWFADFRRAAWQASVVVASPPIFVAPDGFRLDASGLAAAEPARGWRFPALDTKSAPAFPLTSVTFHSVISVTTETRETAMRLTPVMERYVLHWGEMGARWGVNRSVAQIHALLYLSPQPLTAEEIADTLGLARSNVSTSLRELQGWGLVNLTHLMGDRRDHFEARTDLWEMLLTIVEERKRREVDPTLAVLRQCVDEAGEDKETDPEIKARIEGMLRFLETLSAWYAQMRSLPESTLLGLVRMGAKVAKVVKLAKG